MIKVECESCRAPYDLDERRLPPGGLKMRCPKCNTVFVVRPPNAPGAAGAAPAPPAAPVAPRKATQLGVAAPTPAPVAAPAIPRPAGVAPRAATTAFASPASDADLPAPRVGPKPSAPADLDLPALRTAPVKPKAPTPAPGADADLPALRARSPLAPPPDLDLPAPRPRAPLAPPPDLDLPAPRPRAPLAPPPDLDLPAPRPRAPLAPPPDLDLPAPRPRAPLAPPPDLDLPAPRTAAKPPPDLDLPAPRPRAPLAPPPDLDLPAPRPRAPLAPPPDLDLPAPRTAGAGHVDLPAPRTAGGHVDLPMPRGPTRGAPAADPNAELMTKRRTGEVLLGELDLPAPKTASATPGFGDLDLPAPKGQIDLPAPRAASAGAAAPPAAFSDLDLPTPRGEPPRSRATPAAAAGFGDLDLPAPKGQIDLPAPMHDFGSVDLPAAKDGLDLPALRGGHDADAIELDLDPGPPLTSEPPRGEAYGELELPAAPGAGSMEFDAVPQRTSGPGFGPAPTTPFPLSVAARPRETERKAPAAARAGGPRGRGPLIVLGVLVVVLGGGGAALGATPYGFFGTYFAERWLPQAGTPGARAASLTRASRLAASDTLHDTREALRILGAARRQTGLDRELIAESVASEALYQVRFGDDNASSSRISAMMARLDERAYDGPGMALARAADALRNHDAAGARSRLATARRDAPRDVIVDLVAGETALAEGASADAAERFRAAVTHGGGARAEWGLARALLAATDAGGAAAIDTVLHDSPRHVAARTAKARLLLAARDLDGATTLLRQASGLDAVDGTPLSASHHERVEALVVLGRLEEDRARLGDAERAYEGALALDATDTGALLGAGRVLLREERMGDALARFDAVLHSGKDGPLDGSPRTIRQEATLYAARVATSQDRAQDAKQALTELLAARPEDPDVLLALGRAEQAQDDNATAESRFRDVIRLAPSRFDGYLALAQLLTAQTRTDEAAATLAEAGQHVPATADVRRAMGEAELARGAYDEASLHFGEAIALDPTDESALFGLGTANRRAGHFDAAIDALDRLAQRDHNYPGLALERGLVLEARGQSAEAADAYAAALTTRPDDADLLLRLGAAQLAAQKLDDAQHTAERVANLRPNSAEAEYLLGRVAFSRGDTANALAHFDRAVSLDATRGEYLLYDAWASLESGNLGKAAQQIDEAVTRDPSLGDAYWIRGEVRLRTGLVQDALTDLRKALVLHPGRADALAAMGECFDQLRDRAQAIASYQRAVGADAENGKWWYRLGSISFDDGRGDAARSALSRAVLLGEAMRVRPPWVPEAHRVYGDALKLHGDRALALEQYRRYLEIAPPSAIDRDEVERTVQQLAGR